MVCLLKGKVGLELIIYSVYLILDPSPIGRRIEDEVT